MDVVFVLVMLVALLAFAASIVMLLVSALFKKGLSVKQAGLAAGLSFAVLTGSGIGVGSTAEDVEPTAGVDSEQLEAQKEKEDEKQRIALEEAEIQAAEEKEKEEARLAAEKEAEEKAAAEELAKEKEAQLQNEQFAGYKLIEVDGGDLSGTREAKIVADIGYGDREYWAFTNEHGQLERVVADEIIVQDDSSETVLSSGRYYSDEAKVPGVESDVLDEGHVIADSLGGVANAYNITPQESTLNRHGDQAYMEDAIRDAGGATNFEAIITYPDTETQIPSSYQYTYTVMGNEVVDAFDNINPDEVNASLGLTDSEPAASSSSTTDTVPAELPTANTSGDVSSVDTNGNGQVTIKEAKAAGFSMPITSDHWLYPYMRDNDNDGMVGE
ncbi:DNA/RNA non-specific endonuclease [Planococcus sp. 4-30]|uniref:DNA/RNA non-specific endonuclease n=1 Tax=Planococcus sp. 4-30 TaxID=2874583 RepID=UPI001CC093CD|nr:DNA/RNA non-specific endonuclease [Planococcus sp. 4-30]